MKAQPKAEAELSFLKNLFTLSPTPYLVKDADDGFRYVRCNEAFARLVGRTKTEILGCVDEDVVGADQVQKCREHDLKALEAGESISYEEVVSFRAAPHEHRLIHQKTVLTDGRGHRLIFCSIKDVTEDRRKSEADSFKAGVSSYLVEHHDQDRVIEYTMRRLMHYFQCEHVLLVDVDGSRRDLCRDDVKDTICNICDDCPMRVAEAAIFGERNEVRVDDVSTCEWLKLPSGCPNKSILARQVVFNGQSYGRLAIFHTIRPRSYHETDVQVLRHAANVVALSIQRARAAEELARKNRELVEERDRAVDAERAKSYFFSTVSHDIRTPLNAIIGFSQLLKLGVKDDAEREHVIDSIVVSGKTLLQLINDVLDLSKLEAGRMEILPDPTDCRRLVQEIVDSFKASNTNKELEVRGVAGEMPILLLDAQRVRQVLFNLVGNAMKFTKKGFVEVRANFNPTTSSLTFEVQDTGCGISAEDQQKIADPYVQVGEKGGRNGGTGLGLAICRQLVTAMNGEIELASSPGKGTTFFVVLNDVKNGEKVRRERLSATQQMRVSVPAALSNAVSSVLLVDDSSMNLNVLKAMLARFGVENVATAGNGVEALAQMKEKTFDLVLTDLWMPEMDGEALVKEIRKNEAWKELPVYAVTADVEAQKTASKSGFTDVLLKPLTFEKLKMLFA